MVRLSASSLKLLFPLSSRASSSPSASQARNSARPSSADIPEDTHAVLRTSDGECGVSISTATQQALEPNLDSHVIKARDNDHIFVAVFSAASSAPGLRYLRIKLHQQLQAQLRLQDGAISAVSASFAAIDSAYRRLHPFHGDVFEGVSLTLVYIDVSHHTVYLASCGDCQAAACSLQDSKAVMVASRAPESTTQAALHSLADVQTLPLDSRLDGIVLGSAGLWKEVAPSKALLRLQHLALEAPSASKCNPAAHLANFAMHGVTKRMRRLSDPRMQALSSVSALDSLWLGSRANFPGQERMPLRRRRGDVHADMTAIVIRLHWPGHKRLPSMCPGCRLYKTVSAPLMGNHSAPQTRPTAAARWDLLRMHFRSFPAASRRQTIHQWHALVDAALAQAHEQGQRLLAAEALLFGSPAMKLAPPTAHITAFAGGDIGLSHYQQQSSLINVPAHA